ncbi:hypothetical protein PILCRDRAFT_17170 [Piloderma croceum F 1598]|uniref:Uncharacterized protein n=1 Tax=Piloderma croceum (strain F 1598) TaxID=765440 RepID=A0A0C3ETA6_PILCF|nr:hypothetical protein PILCRDRAFT_17170 [Piloderma croceum F 1598]
MQTPSHTPPSQPEDQDRSRTTARCDMHNDTLSPDTDTDTDMNEKDGGDGAKGDLGETGGQVLLNRWELCADSGMSGKFWSISVNGRKNISLFDKELQTLARGDVDEGMKIISSIRRGVLSELSASESQSPLVGSREFWSAWVQGTASPGGQIHKQEGKLLRWMVDYTIQPMVGSPAPDAMTARDAGVTEAEMSGLRDMHFYWLDFD